MGFPKFGDYIKTDIFPKDDPWVTGECSVHGRVRVRQSEVGRPCKWCVQEAKQPKLRQYAVRVDVPSHGLASVQCMDWECFIRDSKRAEEAANGPCFGRWYWVEALSAEGARANAFAALRTIRRLGG